MTTKQLIKLIDKCIRNMAVKGVYYPRRILPKWDSLTNDKDKLAYFEKIINSKKVSTGFERLVGKNLCEKTLEAIIIHHPEAVDLIKGDNILDNCIHKFSKYDYGKTFLKDVKTKNVETA